MSEFETVREAIIRVLLGRLSKIDGVISVSLVGSICERDDLSSIADIDTIVICEDLTRTVFDACVGCVESIDGSEIGLPGKSVYVNSTFGPLKFDTDEQAVVHLMIYDRTGHRAHVLKSPFTCFDWERNSIHIGPHLAEIYPVLRLQPRDFLGARRGLSNYIEDLENGVISFRRYEFGDDGVAEAADSQVLDPMHRGEYAYHIMHNLVVNYAKLQHADNTLRTGDDLLEFWREALPELAAYVGTFEQLKAIKLARGNEYPHDVVRTVKAFVQELSELLTGRWESAPRVVFVRHAKTDLNDGSFLGQGRDPGVTSLEAITPLEGAYGRVYSSPQCRADQTARGLCPTAEISHDERLKEINYGTAEGLRRDELAAQYPLVVDAWAAGKDPRFPDGENTLDVVQRLWDFIGELRVDAGESVVVVTHNVVLRCLCGQLLGLPMRDWHKVLVPHLLELDVLQHGGEWVANFSAEAKAALTDSLVGWKDNP
ncbi:MAG: histidine phosphatase family protein [Verrucomicrobia bacterium]|nr:histidine phosphatase family protein [Verrucomicrobiota bacterium]MDA1086705.1 histidine phosphatase family protein [Verrucomicrobiota bacterium]